MDKQAKQQHEAQLIKARATVAVTAPFGVYNVAPWSFILGICGAVFAVLFTLYILTRAARSEDTPDAATRKPAGSQEFGSEEELIWLD